MIGSTGSLEVPVGFRLPATAIVLVCGASLAFPRIDVLQKKSCELPPELRGVTGHALMRYRVNAGGHVNFIEPAWSLVSPADKTHDLLHHLRQCLEQWKYQPGGDGEALQGFHYFGPMKGTPELVPLPGGRKVPLSHIQEMRDAKLHLAAQLLSGPALREDAGTGWVLRSSVRLDERKALISAIQSADLSFRQVFPGRPSTSEQPVMVLVFGGEDPFNKVSAFDNLYIRFKPAGQYLPEERIAYTYASRRDAPLSLSENYVRHEVTHHFIYDRLAGFKRRPPFWVNEGIATYIENLRPPRKDKVDRFRFVRGQQVEGGFRWPAESDRFIEMFERHALKPPDPGRFLRGDFDEMDVGLAYGLSWILAHYFVNGEQGTLHQPFVAWMTTTMGSPEDPGIASVLGRTPEQIFAALPAHVAAMKRGG